MAEGELAKAFRSFTAFSSATLLDLRRRILAMGADFLAALARIKGFFVDGLSVAVDDLEICGRDST